MPYGEDYFTGRIDKNGNIWSIASGREQKIIGIDNDREQEYITESQAKQAIIDNYYEKLVTLGVIERPKTPEEIAQDAANEQMRILNEQNQALFAALQQSNQNYARLENKVEELMNRESYGYVGQTGLERIDNDGTSGTGTGESGNDIKSNRAASKPNNSGNRARKKDTPGGV